MDTLTPTQITIRQDGSRVMLVQGNQIILDFPWEVAADIVRAITEQARKAEKYDESNLIVTGV